jgi:hypothetical protein
MLRKRVLPLTAALVLFATSAVGGSQSVTFPDKADAVSIPAGTALHFRNFATDGSDTANFGGTISLSGTYYLNGGDLGLVLVPDKATIAKLPRLKHHEIGDPYTLSLSNGEAFARAIMPVAAVAALKRKTDEDFVSGTATIIVDRVQVRLACEESETNAHFVSLTHSKPNPGAEALESGDC